MQFYLFKIFCSSIYILFVFILNLRYFKYYIFLKFKGPIKDGMSKTHLQGKAPIMRMFGVTQGGNSVTCHVHGFFPYFYVTCPTYFKEEDHLSNFKVSMNWKLKILINIYLVSYTLSNLNGLRRHCLRTKSKNAYLSNFVL